MSRLIKGFLIVGIEKALYMLIQLLSIVILARLISPDEYGIIGIAAIFTSLSSLLIDSGMGGSLVYHKDSDKKDFSTIFWFNLCIAIIIYIILFSISGIIADFYNIPILKVIIRISALSVVFTSFGFTQLNKLTKDLQFKKLAEVNIIAYALATIIAIILAVLKLGIWALVMQQLLHSCIKTILLFFYAKFLPELYFSKALLKKHFFFGSSLMLSSFLKTIYDNTYAFVLGKWVSISTVGYFNQAKRIQDIPYQFTGTILDQATFPVMSKIEDDKDFYNTARKIIRIIFILFFPILMIISLCSSEIITIILGREWLPSAPILVGLTFGTLALLGEAVNRNFIKARGATKLIFKLELFKKTSAIVLVIASIYWGIYGLVVSFVFNALIAYICNAWGTGNVSLYNIKKQSNDFIYCFIMSFIPYLITCFIFIQIHDIGDILSLIFKSLLYLVFYIATLYISNNSELKTIRHKLINIKK